MNHGGRTARASDQPARTAPWESMMSVAVSATLAANEALDERRRAGLPVLPLAFGEAGLPVLPALEDQLAAAAGRGAYGPVAGTADLRTAAAGYWSRRGTPADPD